MMATAFPVGLPRPLRAGYGFSVAQPHTETQNDRGLGRRRRAGIGKTVTMTLAWRFTDSELQTFAQWWRDDIAYGTAPFEIQLLNGYDDVGQDVRPMGPYVAQNLIGAWEVTMPVELAEAPVASQGDMQDAIDYYDDLILLDDFHTLVHITIPWGFSCR
jgi:hypothetical protein